MEYVFEPVGWVRGTRKTPEDDDWGREHCFVELSNGYSEEALLGLETFSHAEILFLMHRVSPDAVERGARHPRNRGDWPKVGIFAQRGKNRPNRIGACICSIDKVEGRHLFLKGLDAIDGSPVLDIKPWVKEFGPQGELRQPDWMSELMARYWG